MSASAQQVAKWKDMIEKTLDRMERERINIDQYLDELKIKYNNNINDEKTDDNVQNNNKKISLLVNINSEYLCDTGHEIFGSYVKGKCIGCETLSNKNIKCETCMRYDEIYNISNVDKTGNKYLWCEECMTETNKQKIREQMEKNELLIEKVTRILNENPQINIDLLCKLKGKTSLEYVLKDICIDENIHCYSLYTFDVDGFKKINEEKGHDGADDILKEIGKILNNMEKKSIKAWNDEKVYGVTRMFAFRQGGDEFSIITDSDGYRIHEQEGIYPYLKNEINKLGITISVGMCCAGLYGYDKNGLDTVSKWLTYADKNALYAAKKSGKNTIRIWDNKQKKIVSAFKNYKGTGNRIRKDNNFDYCSLSPGMNYLGKCETDGCKAKNELVCFVKGFDENGFNPLEDNELEVAICPGCKNSFEIKAYHLYKCDCVIKYKKIINNNVGALEQVKYKARDVVILGNESNFQVDGEYRFLKFWVYSQGTM